MTLPPFPACNHGIGRSNSGGGDTGGGNTGRGDTGRTDTAGGDDGVRDGEPQIVIIGAGQAGGSAAAFLRQFGWAGGISLLGDEDVPPYQRPPLSKAWLTGEADGDALWLRTPGFYADQRIALHTGTRVETIDRAARAVILEDGRRLAYDHLIIATGAAPRRLALPGTDLDGVLELRSLADATRIRDALRPGAHLAVIGGGYVGLEVAASARGLGLAVTVIEREARLLARVASPALAAHVSARHAAAGVDLRVGADVAGLDGHEGRIAAVRLADGTRIGCDAVLIGVGAVPRDGLARACGLACDDGIIVDAACRTDDPAILAIGDCTRHPLPHYGVTARLESVPNATEQARQAAAAICGRKPPPAEVPWFWSDQYEMRIQIAGLPIGAVAAVARRDEAAGRLAVFHLGPEARLLAVETVGSVTDFAGGRMLIGRRARLDAGRLADPACPLPALVIPD